MKRLLSLLLALIVCVLLISVFLWLFGFSPSQTFQVIVQSTWGSQSGFALLLIKTGILCLTGLAVVIPYRAGLFNIGGEGQMLTAGLLAGIVGTWPLNWAGPLHWVLGLSAGMLIGAFWAWIAGILLTRRGVHEVISTILMNFIAIRMVNELTYSVFAASEGSSRIAFIEISSELPILIKLGSSDSSIGVLLAVFTAVALSIVLYKTWFGFELRASGKSIRVAEVSGINAERYKIFAMLTGGACAGLAGAIQTLGVDHTFYARLSGGSGFDGIAVAFLALAEPWATVPAALVIATLRASDRALQLDIGLPKEFIFIMEGLLIICIAIFVRRSKHGDV